MGTSDGQPGATVGPPIFVVSGSSGASGDHLVRTVLAQFEGVEVPVVVVPLVQHQDQLAVVMTQAATTGGMIVHTLVDPAPRAALIALAAAHGVVAIDLMGPLLTQLATKLGRAPAGQPGRYRRLHQRYFERVEAIEYTVAHDDGADPAGWGRADLMLLGVSRVGKTPLSMYLAIQGWKVANMPVVLGAVMPHELQQLDGRRVVGLTMQPDALVSFRRTRQRRLHLPGTVDYIDHAAVVAELIAAERLCRQLGGVIIDVTDRPIEETASEIVAALGRSLIAPGTQAALMSPPSHQR